MGNITCGIPFYFTKENKIMKKKRGRPKLTRQEIRARERAKQKAKTERARERAKARAKAHKAKEQAKAQARVEKAKEKSKEKIEKVKAENKQRLADLKAKQKQELKQSTNKQKTRAKQKAQIERLKERNKQRVEKAKQKAKEQVAKAKQKRKGRTWTDEQKKAFSDRMKEIWKKRKQEKDREDSEDIDSPDEYGSEDIPAISRDGIDKVRDVISSLPRFKGYKNHKGEYLKEMYEDLFESYLECAIEKYGEEKCNDYYEQHNADLDQIIYDIIIHSDYSLVHYNLGLLEDIIWLDARDGYESFDFDIGDNDDMPF